MNQKLKEEPGIGFRPSGVMRRFALALGGLAAMAGFSAPSHAASCTRDVSVDVVVIDAPIVNSRLGVSNVNGMMYALKQDVVRYNGATGAAEGLPGDVTVNDAGQVKLRDDKRPRPLVLRVNAGDCLTVNFTNLLNPIPNARNFIVDADPFAAKLDPNPVTADRDPQITTSVNEQVLERRVGFHAAGMQLLADGGILNDGSNTGRNASSLTCAPGTAGAACSRGEPTFRTYKLYAEKEGVFQITNPGALVGSDANQGNLANGLFGQVIVEPVGARTYRNTVTEEELRLASGGLTTAKGQPKLNYDAVYPNTAPWTLEGKAGKPILNMICTAAVQAQPGANCTLNQIVHTEVDAVVAGPDADGSWKSVCAAPGNPDCPYPLERELGKRNPAYANRLEAFRDFAQVWHDEIGNSQAYPGFYNLAGFIPPNGACDGTPGNAACNAGAGVADPLTQVFAYLLKGVRDKFAINYGTGGIGTEILSNRLGVGPMHDCVSCAYEEFFLTHFTVGEIGQLVDIPANQGLETITPQNVLNILLALKGGPGAPALTPLEQFYVTQLGPKATKPFYPGDPANINHSYVGDFVKFRNTHNGFEQHVFHLHNHQWLFNPNDDNSNYLDAQGIGPGMGYTYEIANGGSGNRNKSAGDAIYHCHFYPHFAQGMWYMWRIHDVYETGTVLAVTPNTQGTPTGFHADPFALKDGTPANTGGALPTTLTRALPDGEIAVGTPIAAVVPLPGKPLPPMPSTQVTVKAFDRNGDGKADSSQALVNRAGIRFDGTWNPGYPFWVAGIACETNDGSACEQGIVGQRPTTPPLDMVTKAQAQALTSATTGVAPFKDYGPTMKANFVNLAGDYTQMHGGLPRSTLHGVASGSAAGPTIAGIVSPVDLTKFVEKAKPAFFPEGGTDIERAAMAVHAKRNHASVTNEGTAGNFVLNGLPAVPGAVYSDPCVDDKGVAAETNGPNTWFGGASLTAEVTLQSGPYGAYSPRIYRGTNIQFDAVLNKVGYHYPQQRIVSLWEDALPVINKNKPPEPLVMRLNTFDCAMYHHTNLVPEIYEMDDYQLRTPTDIIGQHIHLPKWDLTTTDGAANGWNYEDGTLAPGAVRERIHAINLFNDEHACAGHTPITPDEALISGAQTKDVQVSCPNGTTKTVKHLVEQPHPFFGATGPGAVDWRGARTTLQRWYADPLLNTQNQDRGLGIIFTHDHYGPSTFQQVGLYSTVLIEPAKSTWAHNETGGQLGCRNGANNTTRPAATSAVNNAACRYDGGPTSWQAIIDTAASGPNGDVDGDGKNDSFREFYFEHTDFQHAYEAGVYVGAGNRGQHNGDFDEKAYLGFSPALQGLFYPKGHPGPADGLYPAFAPGAAKSDTFRFSIAPPLILPVRPIFPDLTVEALVTLGTGALAGPLAQGFVTPHCIQRPCPTSIDFLEPGMFVVNYRNEPVGLRIYDPAKVGPDGKRGAQADKAAGDLALAFSSTVTRRIAALNVMPGAGTLATPPADAAILPAANRAETRFPPHINVAGFQGGDPFTPMMRTYSGDKIRVKVQAGGDEEEHSIGIHGIKWLQAGSGHGRAPNSGWRNQQSGGISEQFTAYVPIWANANQRGRTADYLYAMDAHQDGFWNGNWGILRNYDAKRNDLAALPNNPTPVGLDPAFFQGGDLNACPKDAPLKQFKVAAVPVNDILPKPTGVTIAPPGEQLLSAATPGNPVFPPTPLNTLHAGAALNPNGGTLVYNSRTTPVTGTAQGIRVNETGPLHDPTAIIYMFTDDVIKVQTGTDKTTGLPTWKATGVKQGVPIEPLVMRVNAGDCVQVELTNLIQGEKSGVAADLPNYNDTRHAVKRERLHPQGSTTFQVNHFAPSNSAGFHAQLLEYDVTRSDGHTVGINPDQTAKAGGDVKRYGFYVGDLVRAEQPVVDRRGQAQDFIIATPVEFGGVNILPADRVKQPQKGLFGQIIVEPKTATWTQDPSTRTKAVVNVAARPATPLTGVFGALPAMDAHSYTDFALVWQKMMNYRYASGNPVQNESEEGPGTPENPPHTIINAANYRAEPTFFRFGIPPLSAAGGAACSPAITAPKAANPADLTCFGSVQNQGDLFSNVLTGGADPQTPVFTVKAADPQATRIHLTNPNSSNRGATVTLHGHVWARDPFLAQRRDAKGFPLDADGTNDTGGVGSVDIAPEAMVNGQRVNGNPMSFYIGAQDNVLGGAHYTIVLPQAGGVDGVAGDYLIRDTASAGMGGGAWGILRVE